MTPTKYPLSVHLVMHNGARWLPFCLESLARSKYQDFFLLMIDNGSLDGTNKVLEQWLQQHPQFVSRSRIVTHKHNLGFARAHNQAMSWTESDYIMLLNQDIILEPDYIEKCVRVLANDDAVAAATGKLLHWDFDPISFHFGVPPSASRLIDSMGLLVRRSRRVSNIGEGKQDDGQFDAMTEVFGVSGAAPLYRREALRAVSPDGRVLDEDFISYKEDVDLAWRLRLAGYRACVVPTAVAYHDRSLVNDPSFRTLYKRRASWARDHRVYSWVNHLATLIKNEAALNVIPDLPWILWYEMKKFGYLLVFDPVTLILAIKRFGTLLPRWYARRRELKPTRVVKASQLRSWFDKATL